MIETHYDCPCLDKCPLNYAMTIIGGKWKMQDVYKRQGRIDDGKNGHVLLYM